MPAVLTILRVDADAGLVPHTRALTAQLDGVAGEPELVVDPARGTVTAVVAFHLAAEAVDAALRLIAALPPAGRPRMALATGRVEVDAGLHRGPVRDRVDRALEVGDGPPMLLSSSTAVMVASALPAGAELVAVATSGDDRLYELRWSGPGDDDMTASNLGWAHRAAARPVIGRAGPRARLEGAWAAAVDGSHRLVVLSGDPGIGKTTLAAEQALRAHAGGGIVLYGRWDEDALAPYQAVREALGSYAAACSRSVLRRDVAAHAEDLARLLPDLGARLGGVRAPLTDDPDAERLRLFDAVRHWLGAIAGRRPVLLVLDDLQWADHSSLRLLRHLVDEPPAGPVLIVVTLRDGDVEGMGPLHSLGSFEAPGVDRIELTGLDVDAVVELIAQVFGRPGAVGDDAAAARWLTEQTAGNPLLVHEILRGLDPDDPATALAEARRRLPQRVHDVVRWRLSRLGPEVDETLAAASIVGERFSLDVVASALGRRPLDLRRHLDEAARAGVVRDTDDAGTLAFAHAVVRRALQDDVPDERATVLHRRVALALSEGPDPIGSAAEIARHHLLAVDEANAAAAVRSARTAADQARLETAFESAAAFLSGAVDVHDRYGAAAGSGSDGREAGDPRELGCELRCELAEAHDRAGEFIARDRRYLEAADLARALGRTDLFGRAALGYGGRLPATPPRNPVARRLLEEALERLPAEDGRARALTLARLAHVLHGVAAHDERRALADEAEAMARRLDAPVVVASVLGSRVLALDGPDDVDDNLEIGAEIMRIGERVGDPDLVLQGARARIHPLFVVGAHDAARDLAGRFAELAETVQHPDHLRLATMWQVMWAVLEGRFAEAKRLSDVLRVRLEVAGHPQAGAIHFMQSFVVEWLHGDPAATAATVQVQGIQEAESTRWWALQAWVAAAVGDVDGAVAHLYERNPDDLESLDPGYQWQTVVVGAAIAAATAGEQAWAEVTYRLLAPYSGRNTVLGYLAYLGAVDHHLGALAAVLGRHDDAVTHLEAALERHRVLGARPWIALTAAWLANVLTERDGGGDADRAGALLAEALDLAETLGLRALPAPHPKLR